MRGFLLRIYIDHDKGIALADCEQVSRQLVAVLDVEDPMPGPYQLEVSSPGLARPLFTLAQFRQFVGAKVQLRLCAGRHDRGNRAGRKIVGSIEAVGMDEVLLIEKGQRYRLAADEIEQAHIVPQF